MGNRWRWVWLLALANCVLWTWWTVLAGAWGMMPLNVFAGIVAVRNHLRWERERLTPEQRAACLPEYDRWLSAYLKTPEGEAALRKAGL
jgi:hypothetical protein